MAHDCGAFGTGLSHEDPVEGIPVVSRQSLQFFRVPQREWQLLEVIRCQRYSDRLRYAKPAFGNLDRDLQRGCDADPDGIRGGNRATRLAIEPPIVGQPPEQHVSIEDQLHHNSSS